jgi:hypothetical protein
MLIESEIHRLWHQYFPDIPLTEPRWFEHSDPALFSKALAIAAHKDKEGRFEVRTQAEVGRYVNAVIRRSKKGIIELNVLVKAGYEITDADKQRFKHKLTASGTCLLYGGTKAAGGYGKFHVNGRQIGAHRFAYFMEVGYLPEVGEIEALQVAHTCGVRECCNPRHLRLTSRQVNLSERAYNERVTEEREIIAVPSTTIHPPSSALPSRPTSPATAPVLMANVPSMPDFEI